MPNFILNLKYLRNVFVEDSTIAVSLVIITLTIIILAWYISNKYKTYSFKDQDPNTGESNSNPKINGSESINPFTKGLQKAGLRQISSFDQDTTADPGNPSNFSTLECEDGLVPISDVISGATICLADFDSECKTVADCRPEAIGCINNKCSLLSNINQPCKSDTDCWNFEGKRVNNYTCVKEFGSVTGYCKVDAYPKNSGCNYNSDCNGIGLFNEVTCLKDESSTYIQNYQNSLIEFNISKANNIVYFKSPDDGVNHNFWPISTQVVLYDFDDRTKVTEDFLSLGSNYGGKFYTGIISGTSTGAFNVIDLMQIEQPSTAVPITSFGSPVGMVSFGGYPNYTNAVESGYVGICIEKLPRGAPSNVKIGNIEIPCQDQFISIGGRCVEPHWSGKLGQICTNLENDTLSSNPLQCNDNSVNLPVGCSYDYITTNNALDSFLYLYNPKDYNIYQLGMCSVEIRDIANPCSLPFEGCSRPYICLPTLSDSKNVNTVCLQPLDVMFCSQGAVCPKNYTCDTITSDLGVCIPVCKGLKDAIAFQSSDCVAGHDSNNLYLQMYSTDANAYIPLITMEGNKLIDLNYYKIVLSNAYTTVEKFPGIIGQTKMPSSIMIYGGDDSADSVVKICNLNTTTNTYNGDTKTFYVNTNNSIETKIIYDPDGNLAIFNGYDNRAIPEFGYPVRAWGETNGYISFDLTGYNIFNDNNISFYTVYLYSPDLDLDEQENYVFNVGPSVNNGSGAFETFFSCTTTVLWSNRFIFFPVFAYANSITTSFYMIFSIYNPSTDNQLFSYRNYPSVSDNLFHIPQVYKFDSNNINTRQLIKCPLFNTGDEITTSDGTKYYLEELYPDSNNTYSYIFNLHTDYFGAEGDVMISSSGNKVFNINDTGGIAFESLTFSYNTNTKIYTMNIIDLSQNLNEQIIYITDPQTLAMNKASINGINRSISYIFDKNIDVDISIENNNDKNYIYFRTDIAQQNSVTGAGTSITNVYVQKIEYASGTSNYNSAYDNIYFSNYTVDGTTTTGYYNYKYTNNLAIPRTKTTPGQGSFVSSFEETFFDNQEDTIQFMTTFKNDNNDEQTQVAAFSRFNQKEFVQASGDIGTSYANYNVFESQQFQPYTIESNISLDESSKGNRVTNNGLNIVFTDEDVVETIISFPSSEIVLTNNGSTLLDYYISGDGTSSINSQVQKVWPGFGADFSDVNSKLASTQYTEFTEVVRSITVSEYDLDAGELTVKLNAPLDVNSNYVKDIFNNNSVNKPKLWLHNFAPLTYLNGESRWFSCLFNSSGIEVEQGSGNGEENLVTILDGSLIYGGTKSQIFKSNSNISRSSYNKLTIYDTSSNKYNSYLVRDNYFGNVSYGFDVSLTNDLDYDTDGSVRSLENIFYSAMSQYTEDNTWLDNSNHNLSLRSGTLSLNVNNNIFGPLNTLANTFSSSAIGGNYASYFSTNLPSSNITLLSQLTYSDELQKQDYFNNYRLPGNAISQTEGSYFSSFLSKIFYSSGTLDLTQTNMALPSKVPIFEINQINVIYATGAENISSTQAGIFQDNIFGPIDGCPYQPNKINYSTYSNSLSNKTFCYFKRKYLIPRLWDRGNALTSMEGNTDLVGLYNNTFEIYPIGNNKGGFNQVKNNVSMNELSSSDTPSNYGTAYWFANGGYLLSGVALTPEADTDAYTKQPIESYKLNDNRIDNITLSSQSASLLGFMMADYTANLNSMHWSENDVISKEYYDIDGFLFITYTNNAFSLDTSKGWFNLLKTDSSSTASLPQYNSFQGNVKSYLNSSSGYLSDLKSYKYAWVAVLEIRPLNSATICLPYNQGQFTTNNKLYIINNMFMTSIERPLNSVADDIKSLFRFNNRKLINNVYIINSFTYNNQTYYRMTGQINFPINTCPTIIGKNSNYNLANSEVLNFPTHFTERFVSSEMNNFVIDKLYTSYKFGNDFSKLRYYVYGHYNVTKDDGVEIPSYQLLYLSTSSERMLLSKDRGIPTSLSFLENAKSLNIENAIVYEPFNNLIIILSSKCT